MTPADTARHRLPGPVPVGLARRLAGLLCLLPALLAGTPCTARAELPVIVRFDLLGPGGREVSLSAPRGRHFDVRLIHRAPNTAYRVTADWLLAPGSPKPPERALHQTYDLPPTAPSLLRPLPFGPPCDDLQREVLDLLRSTDEAQTAAMLTTLEARTLPKQCDNFVRYRLDAAQPRLKTTYSLHDGDRLVITVDRLDQSRGVQRTWRAVVRPEGFSGKQQALRTEEEWVVRRVVLDIAEMIRFAREANLPDADHILVDLSRDPAVFAPAYRVEVDVGRGSPISRGVVLEDHLWSPRNFEGLARSLLVQARLRGSTGRNRRVLEALLTPTAAVLRGESRRASARLAESMGDAGAHADAALILGTLALREPGSEFADIRPALNRIAAHLALARALDGAGTPPRQRAVAEALLATLVGRQREALDRLDLIEDARPSGPERAWVRVLRMRNTRDWRVLETPDNASLLERLTWFRVALRARERASTLELLDRTQPEPTPDWGWLALGYFPHVGTGNRFGRSTDRLTRHELEEAWREEGSRALGPGTFTQALGDRAGGCIERAPTEGSPQPRVIGWGMWAEFYQRQLLATALQVEHHLRHMLAAEEAAASYRNESQSEFHGLRLFPVVRRRWTVALVGDAAGGRSVSPTSEEKATPPEHAQVCASFASAVRESPEIATFASWEFMERMCARARDTGALPPKRDWFRPGLPSGTAYDARVRSDGWRGLRQEAPTPEALFRIAPFSWPVLDNVVWSRYGNAPSPEQLISALGPLTEYDITAMRWIARQAVGDVAVHTHWLEKMAELDPDVFVRLGGYLSERELDDRAAAAYETGLARGRDRVGLSLHVNWLVDYYFRHGRIDDATRVAREAAGVGSSGGMETMGRVMERMERPLEAEAWYQRVADRYNRKTSLQRFYIRHQYRHRDGRFESAAAEALTEVFPEGLEEFAPEAFSTEPESEEAWPLSTLDFDEKLRRFGLRVGDRIVALNGLRVRNEQQYLTVMSLRDKPAMTAAVWRDGRLEMVSGRYRRYRYDPLASED